MKRLFIVSLVLMLILQGCDINIMGGVSINSVDSKYQFKDYQGYLAVKDDVAEDDDYFSYDMVERYDVVDLELYTIFEDIEVVEEAREDIEVRYFVIYDPVLKNNGPEAQVTKTSSFKVDIQWDSFNGKAHGMMEVRVPQGFGASLLAQSVSGDIEVDSMSGDRVDLETTSGDLDLYNVHFEVVKLDSTSGDVNLKDSEAVEVNCETTSGDILVEARYLDEVTLDSTSGDIEIKANELKDTEIEVVSGNAKVQADTLVGDLAIDTVSGSVRLIIKTLDAEVKYDTVSGDFNTSKAMTISSGNDEDVRGTIGSGVHNIDVETTSGDFRIE